CSFFFSYYHYRSILPFFVPSASEICALSLRDALPICDDARLLRARGAEASLVGQPRDADPPELSSAGRRRAQTREGELYARGVRSEEHTSELQSRFDLVCRLLLEKKKNRDHNPSV